jgi:hypothetical protein
MKRMFTKKLYYPAAEKVPLEVIYETWPPPITDYILSSFFTVSSESVSEKLPSSNHKYYGIIYYLPAAKSSIVVFPSGYKQY